jgi:hypothetical protein
MPLPKFLKNWTISIAGTPYSGIAEEVELPKIKPKYDDFRACGMDSSIKVDMGLESLECIITLAQHDPIAYLLMGAEKGIFIIKGSRQAPGGKAEPILATVAGKVSEIDEGSWKAGERTSQKLSISVETYALLIAGFPCAEIDIENGIRVIGGFDKTGTVKDRKSVV